MTIRDGNNAAVVLRTTDDGSGNQIGNVRLTDATGANFSPTMDAVARPGFFKLTDGTNTAPTMDAVARPGFFKLTDGTNTAPTMDTVARKGFQAITDGTDTAAVDATNAALSETAVTSLRTAAHLFGLDAAAGAGSQQVPVQVESTAAPNLRVSVWKAANQMPAMDAAARPGFVKLTDGTNTAPTFDAAARAGFVKLTDGTNSAPTMDVAARKAFHAITDGTNTAGVKAASTGAALTDPALVVAVSPNSAMTHFVNRGLVGTAVAVKASAGNLYAVQVNNTDSSAAFIQFWNTAQGGVTVGTTAPVLELAVPAGNSTVQCANWAFPSGIPFSTAITVASTTTSGGASGNAASKVQVSCQYA